MWGVEPRHGARGMLQRCSAGNEGEKQPWGERSQPRSHLRHPQHRPAPPRGSAGRKRRTQRWERRHQKSTVWVFFCVSFFFLTVAGRDGTAGWTDGWMDGPPCHGRGSQRGGVRRLAHTPQLVARGWLAASCSSALQGSAADARCCHGRTSGIVSEFDSQEQLKKN